MLDKLKRPIAVGDIILTKGYYSCDHNLITAVKKINPVKLVTEATTKNCYTGTIKNIRRYPTECTVITEQLAYNRQTWPELYL